MAFNLTGLSVKQLMQLRVQLNNTIQDIEEAAFDDLVAGKKVPFFKLKKGRTTRYVENKVKYETILSEVFAEEYENLCVVKSVIPLTKAEALVKKQFDGDDCKEILASISTTLGTQTSASKLTYTGDDD